MTTKFITKATARNGFTYAVQKRGNGSSIQPLCFTALVST